MKVRYSYENKEFNQLIAPIINETTFQGLIHITHHGVTRYHHCQRVAYYTYHVTKFLHLNYQEATKGALLHDFFYDREGRNKKEMLVEHPQYAKDMAAHHFGLTLLEEDIILSHMFPVSPHLPRYLESWIVDIVDDVVGIYEKFYSVRTQLSQACSFLFLFMIILLRK